MHLYDITQKKCSISKYLKYFSALENTWETLTWCQRLNEHNLLRVTSALKNQKLNLETVELWVKVQMSSLLHFVSIRQSVHTGHKQTLSRQWTTAAEQNNMFLHREHLVFHYTVVWINLQHIQTVLGRLITQYVAENLIKVMINSCKRIPGYKVVTCWAVRREPGCSEEGVH